MAKNLREIEAEQNTQYSATATATTSRPPCFEKQKGFWSLKYSSDAVNREFMRFCHRTLDGFVVMAIYGASALPYRNFSTRLEDYGVYGNLFSIAAIAELLTHLIKKGPGSSQFTYKVALFRQAIHIFSAFLFALMTSWHYRIHDVSCAKDSGYRAMHGYDVTATTEYRSCIRSINAIPFVGIVLSFNILRVDPYWHFPLVLLNGALQVMGAFLVRNESEVFKSANDHGMIWKMDTAELVIRVMFPTVAVLISLLVAYGKHRSLQRSFEAALEAQLQIRASKKRMEMVDRLMSSMVPTVTLPTLLSGKRVLDITTEATVLFSDMVDFTSWSSIRKPRAVVEMLSEAIRSIDILAADMDVSKVKTIGDCYWAVSGLPPQRSLAGLDNQTTLSEDLLHQQQEMEEDQQHFHQHSELMLRFSLKMLALVRRASLAHPDWDYPEDAETHHPYHTFVEADGKKRVRRRPIEMRTGIHSGHLSGGVLGSQQISYEVFGETSKIANKIEASGVADRVCVSRRTRELAIASAPDIFTFVQYTPPAGTPMHTDNGEDETEIIERVTDEDGKGNLFLVAFAEGALGSGIASITVEGAGEGEEMLVDAQVENAFHSRSAENSSAMLDVSSQVSGVSVRSHADDDCENEIETGLEAKEQRKLFVQRHLMRSREEGEDGGDHETTLGSSSSLLLEDVSSKDFLDDLGSGRRHCCCSLTFQGGDLEAEFRKYVTLQLIHFRFFGQLVMLALLSIAFFWLLADGNGPLRPSVAILLLLGMGLLLGSVAFTYERRRAFLLDSSARFIKNHLLVDLKLSDQILPLVAHLAIWLWCVGGILGPESVATNRLNFVATATSVLITIPSNHIPALHLSVLWGITIVCALLNSYWKSHYSFAALIFYIAGFFLVLMIIFLHEKRLRLQFVETKVATHFAAQQALALRAQEAVLKSMLPDFVIEPLSKWLSAEFDPRLTVMIDKEEPASVIFASFKKAVSTAGPMGSAMQTGESLLVNLTTPLRTGSFSNNSSFDRPNAPDSNSNSGNDPALLKTESLKDVEWLYAGHRVVDDLLLHDERLQSKQLDKVKTVGDVVIIAGSFRGHSTTVAAEAALYLAASIAGTFHHHELLHQLLHETKLRNEHEKEKDTVLAFSDKDHGCENERRQQAEKAAERSTTAVSIGLHAGPLMGVVLGYSRLAFDIFGDTVNTCSRVMMSCSKASSGNRNGIAASVQFLDQIGGDDALQDFDLTWGIEKEVHAKGKGFIKVREATPIRKK